MSSLNIEQINPHACKTYLLTVDGSNKAVLIDPVLDHVRDYVALLSERGLVLEKVIDTHTHADHISGAAAVKDLTDCKYVMHLNAPARCVSDRIDDGEEFELLPGITAQVLYSPGHTKDSVSLLADNCLFTGDALFLDDGGAGRDDLPGGDPGLHWETIQKFLGLPGEAVVYPAHDYRERKPSSLAKQKETNPHLKGRTRDEFVNYIEDLKLGPADWMKDVLKANYACARDPKAAWIPADTPACELKGTMEDGVNDVIVDSLTVDALKALMESTAPVLLDVREPEELIGDLGMIEGVINVPIGQLAGRLDELDEYRDHELITVCRSGGRAHTAAQILSKAGFEKARVLEGGMLAWNARNAV